MRTVSRVWRNLFHINCHSSCRQYNDSLQHGANSNNLPGSSMTSAVNRPSVLVLLSAGILNCRSPRTKRKTDHLNVHSDHSIILYPRPFVGRDHHLTSSFWSIPWIDCSVRGQPGRNSSACVKYPHSMYLIDNIRLWGKPEEWNCVRYAGNTGVG